MLRSRDVDVDVVVDERGRVPSGPRARVVHAARRAALVALLALVLPGVALAASTTLSLSDAKSGTGATVVFDDMANPGSLTISIESDGETAADILRFKLYADRRFDKSFPGSDDEVVVEVPGTASLADLEGVRFYVFLGYELNKQETAAIKTKSKPKIRVANLRGKIPAIVPIPEPSTALLMSLGLMGLTAAGSRRNA